MSKTVMAMIMDKYEVEALQVLALPTLSFLGSVVIRRTIGNLKILIVRYFCCPLFPNTMNKEVYIGVIK